MIRLQVTGYNFNHAIYKGRKKRNFNFLRARGNFEKIFVTCNRSAETRMVDTFIAVTKWLQKSLRRS